MTRANILVAHHGAMLFPSDVIQTDCDVIVSLENVPQDEVKARIAGFETDAAEKRVLAIAPDPRETVS